MKIPDYINITEKDNSLTIKDTRTNLVSLKKKLKNALDNNDRLESYVEELSERYVKELKNGRNLANTIIEKERDIKHRNITIFVLVVLLEITLIF